MKNTNDTNSRSGNTATAWIIGGVAILALVLAWVAFNRSGQDVVPTAAEQTRQAAEATEQGVEEVYENVEEGAAEMVTEAQLLAARAEARADLLALQAELEAEESYDKALAEVNEIQNDLGNVYANASAEVRSQYAQLQQEFNELETDLREGTADSLEVLGGLILMLEADTRSDPDPQS